MTTTLKDLIENGATPWSKDDADLYRSNGAWTDRTLRELLSDTAAANPDRAAVVSYADGVRVQSLTYGELDQAVSRAADRLASLGIGPGDTVALMLPNGADYPTLMFAIQELRGIFVGIPVSYGAMQTLPILLRSHTKTVVIPRGWRSNDHLGMLRSLRAELPELEHVIVIDDTADGLESEVLWSSLDDAAPHGIARGSADELCYLGFTSGTTGEPKGAMHTHQTLQHSVERLAEHIGREVFGEHLVQLVASPVGHHTGFVWCTLFTVYMGGTAVHVDRWDAQRGADLIRDEGITTFFGAPTFVQDLMRTNLAGDASNPLRCVVIAGASVPRTLPTRAAAALGAYIAPAWGMTECSITLACSPRDGDGVLVTDGSQLTGSLAKVVDANDDELPTGVVGELLVKGPSLFLGYYERPDATESSFTRDGWFRTGDTASIGERGWVALHGRTKDIIIRGGENIPVADIETLLFDHPDILNVAVVGVPDERLGERAVAAVVVKPGAELDLPAMSTYLLECGLSKHYLPERLEVLDELPMTQSGKIQKFVLRDALA